MAALEAGRAIRKPGINGSTDSAERLKSLFPEGPFPYLGALGIPPGSLMKFFFDQLEPSDEVEEILTQSLCLSLIPAICRYIAAGDGNGEDAFSLPHSDRNPLLFYLVEKESAGEAWAGRVTEAFRQYRGEGSPVFLVPDPAVLLEIGRSIYRQRNLPVASTEALVIVSASSLSTVLMPLALGFHVISNPSLPVHGGPRVEAFFSKGVARRFGGKYLSGRGNLSLSGIMEELKWTKPAI